MLLDGGALLLQVTDEGDVVLSQGAINGFLGGSVGAVGTLIATLVKRDQVKDRLKCPYCEGTGIIQCAPPPLPPPHPALSPAPLATLVQACPASHLADAASPSPRQVRAVPRQLTARLD